MKEPKEVDIAGLSYLEYRLKGGWRQTSTHVERDTWIQFAVWKEDPNWNPEYDITFFKI